MTPEQRPMFPQPDRPAGEWSEYALLILSELRRLNDGLESVKSDTQDVLRKQDSTDAEQRQLQRSFDDFKIDIREDLNLYKKDISDKFTNEKSGVLTRVQKLEDKDLSSTSTWKGRMNVIGIAFIVLTAIVLPTLTIALNWGK